MTVSKQRGSQEGARTRHTFQPRPHLYQVTYFLQLALPPDFYHPLTMPSHHKSSTRLTHWIGQNPLTLITFQ